MSAKVTRPYSKEHRQILNNTRGNLKCQYLPQLIQSL